MLDRRRAVGQRRGLATLPKDTSKPMAPYTVSHCCLTAVRIECGVVEYFSQTKIRHLERTVRREETIAWFDIAVGLNPLAQRVLHAVAELNREAENLRQIVHEPGRTNPLAQV